MLLGVTYWPAASCHGSSIQWNGMGDMNPGPLAERLLLALLAFARHQPSATSWRDLVGPVSEERFVVPAQPDVRTEWC